jgi:murein DD-endopeptidase MepM/ murein hydrolase activator NlpD
VTAREGLRKCTESGAPRARVPDEDFPLHEGPFDVLHAKRPHGRAWALWLAFALVVTLTPASSANDRGDELKDRRQKAERRVDQAHDHLEASTRRLQRAAAALEAAQQRLDRARDVAQKARADRVAAALMDDRAQAALDEAEAKVAAAERRVDDAAVRIRHQEELLRTYAVDAFQSGDPTMLAVSMVLTTDEPTDLMGRLGSMRNVVDRQAAALARVEAARAVLEVERAQLEESRDAVAERREEAAETLERRRGAEQRALGAEAEVQRLTAEAREHRQQMAEARAADLRKYRQMQRERAQVQKLLRKYYAAQRRKARASAGPSRSGGMLWPAQGWVSSVFGMRLHPVYKQWRLHDGLDIAANCGRPVRAASSGVVVARYYNTGYGNRVVIGHGWRNGGSTATTYNHLSRYSTFTGERVRRGEVIGFVGSTGYSTGCHLHFMVLRNGSPVDPRPWLG